MAKGSGGANWSLSDGTITLKKNYLASLAVGATVFTVKFTKDNDVNVTVNISDSTPKNSISPDSATFDKNTSGAGYDDIELTATSLTDATVDKLFLGTTEVAKGEEDANWSVSDGTITLKKEYLATLKEGDAGFTFKFTADNDVDVTVTIEDTTG